MKVTQHALVAFGSLLVFHALAACSPEETGDSSPAADVVEPPSSEISPGRDTSAGASQSVLVTQVLPNDLPLPDATLGLGRLVISGRCVVFDSEALDGMFTVVWPSGNVRWVEADVIGFVPLIGGDELRLIVGQKVELAGIELRQSQSIDFVDPPTVACPKSAVAVHAVMP